MYWLLVAVLAIPPPDDSRPASDLPQLRVEAGAFNGVVTEPHGTWRGVQLYVTRTAGARLRPVVELERQSRPSGTQTRVAIGGYADWSRRFYSYQTMGFAGAPATASRFYPLRRLDASGFAKLGSAGQVVLGGGYTWLTFGSPNVVHVINGGLTLYSGTSNLDVRVFANRSAPGDLWSGAASVSWQRYVDGRHGEGISVSGGRELYRLDSAIEELADFSSVTITGFTRRWLTRRTGIVASLEYQHKIGAYRRVTPAIRGFIEF